MLWYNIKFYAKMLILICTYFFRKNLASNKSHYIKPIYTCVSMYCFSHGMKRSSYVCTVSGLTYLKLYFDRYLT